MEEPSIIGNAEEIARLKTLILNYNNPLLSATQRVNDKYSNDITTYLNSLNNNIDNLDNGTKKRAMQAQSAINKQAIIDKNKELYYLKRRNRGLVSSEFYKQQEVDTLRGRINNSKLVNNSRIFVYIIYILVTLIVIGGLIFMYWFPSKGRLDIFISVIAVLLLLLTFYQ